jgi:hypothetical protein
MPILFAEINPREVSKKYFVFDILIETQVAQEN